MDNEDKGALCGLLVGSGIVCLFNLVLYWSILPIPALMLLTPLSIFSIIVGVGKMKYYRELDQKKDIEE